MSRSTHFHRKHFPGRRIIATLLLLTPAVSGCMPQQQPGATPGAAVPPSASPPGNTVVSAPSEMEVFRSSTGFEFINLDDPSQREVPERFREEANAVKTLRDKFGGPYRNSGQVPSTSLTLDHQMTMTDAEMTLVGKCRKLMKLNLESTSVSDAGLVHLKELQDLEVFTISGPNFTGSGIEHLRDLPKLKDLRLDRSGITDDTLKLIAGLKNLTDLSLGATNITDAGLQHLHGHPKLAEVLLPNRTGSVTEAGVKALRDATPSLQKVHW
jgi:hypothetical protein